MSTATRTPPAFAMQPAQPPMQQHRADALSVRSASARLNAMERSAVEKRAAEQMHPYPPKSQNGVAK